MKPIGTKEDSGSEYPEGYRESNRKTKAFYISMAAMIGLFLYGDMKGAEAEHIINAISNMALVYIGGVAVADAVRYHKAGVKKLDTPEKQEELKDRYKDR